MGVIIPAGYGQVAVEMRQTGMNRAAYFTWGFEGGDGSDPDGDAQAIYTLLSASGRLLNVAQYVAGWSVQRILVTVGTVLGPFSGEHQVETVGTKPGEAAPPQVALLVRKNSALGGRKGRGRLYLPPAFVAETDITQQGTISSSPYGTLRTTVNSTLTALNASSYPVRLLHSTASPGPSAVTQWSLQQVVATQRRRIRS